MPTGLFLAVGYDGLRMVSPDGIRWQKVQMGKEGQVFRAASFGAGRFVAVGTFGGKNLLASTTDGETWQIEERDGGYSNKVMGVAFGAGRFLGVGGNPTSVGNSKPFLVHSTDGLKWSDFLDLPGKTILRRVAYGDGRFVGVGDRGRRSTSTDGLTWEDVPEVKAADTLIDVAYGAGVFVGVGLHGLRMTSRDGLTWTDRQTGNEGEHLNSILWCEDRFVAVGQGATFLSADGKTWTRQPNENAPLHAIYAEGLFLGGHWKGRILASDDGVAWRETHKAEQHVESLAYGKLDL